MHERLFAKAVLLNHHQVLLDDLCNKTAMYQCQNCRLCSNQTSLLRLSNQKVHCQNDNMSFLEGSSRMLLEVDVEVQCLHLSREFVFYSMNDQTDILHQRMFSDHQEYERYTFYRCSSKYLRFRSYLQLPSILLVEELGIRPLQQRTRMQ